MLSIIYELGSKSTKHQSSPINHKIKIKVRERETSEGCCFPFSFSWSKFVTSFWISNRQKTARHNLTWKRATKFICSRIPRSYTRPTVRDQKGAGSGWSATPPPSKLKAMQAGLSIPFQNWPGWLGSRVNREIIIDIHLVCFMMKLKIKN